MAPLDTFDATKRYFIEHMAQKFDLPTETVAARVSDLIAAVQAEVAQRKKPPRLIWGKDSNPGENPAAFAWRAYAAEAKAGTLHLAVIRREDPPLAIKLVSWLRRPNHRKLVPEGFDIPTRPEWHTRQLTKGDAPLKSGVRTIYIPSAEARLYAVQQHRKYRAKNRRNPPALDL